MRDTRFLEGSFAPVKDEITAFDLPVTGAVPAELNGRYLRNGPNPLGLDDPNYHWFLGAGMVHGVRLGEGRAQWYRNRWVRSKAVAQGLGEAWVGGPVHDDADFAANTHIIAHHHRLLATVEAGPLPYELTDELETVGPYDFQGGLPGGYAAHTKLDPVSGELHAIAYYWAWDHVQHVVVDAAGQVSRTTDIQLPYGPMMHDFGLTERYVVLFDLPVTFSMDAVSAGLKLPYTWNPDQPARIGLLPRTGDASGIRWYGIEACWLFHILNAYDDADGRVVIDVCRYPKGYDVSHLRGSGPVTLDRFVLDPVPGTVTETRLDDRSQEFPRTDARAVSRPYRYGYSTVTREVNIVTAPPSGDFTDDAFANALLKHDLLTGRVDAHVFGPDETTAEAVFVPSTVDSAEDDGYLLSFVHNPDRGATDLVILAAQDFTGAPLARVHLPVRVPLGFHGSWIADA